MGCSQKIRYLMFFSLWSVAILRTTDGTAITWYEPPPMTEITNNSFFHAANRSLTEGSANVPLSWNFSLSAGSNVITVTLSFKGATVVTMLPAVPNPTVEDPFNGRFGVSWNPSTKATLIINNVNTVDNGEFTCEVFTLAGSKTTLWTSKVQVTVFVPPRITDNSGNLTVTEGQDVTLECQATGNPTPERTWTRLSNNSVFNGTLPNIRRQDTGGYRCTANNSVGSPATKDIFITVQYPPSTNISGNITVNDTDTVTLNCGEDGVPDPNIAWRRLSDNSSVPVTFNISGKQDEGYYRCTADNGIGNPATGDIFIAVEHYRPRNTSLEANLNDSTVVRNTNFNLTCRADANPPAKYELRREQNSLIRTTIGQDSFTNTTSVNERIKQVTYSCTPFNDYGVGPTETINVTVHYRPLATRSGQNITVSLGRSASFDCPVDGNPEPNITWYKGSTAGETLPSLGKALNFTRTQLDHTGCYTCSASNILGTDTITNCLEVVSPRIDLDVIYYVPRGGNASLYCQVEDHPLATITWTQCGSSNIKCGGSFLNISEVQLLRAIYTCKASSDLVDSSFNTTLVIGGEYINLTLTIRDVECTEENGQVKYDPSVLEALKDKVHEIFADYNYSGIVEVNVRCGSLHVDLVLKFNNPVAEDWVISTFQGAVKNGKLGKLSVNASSIVGIAPVIKSTVTPPITKATPKSEGADGPPWAIIGGVVGAVVVLVIVIAVLTWCVHKKRKCRKDTKIGHSESEAQVLQEGAVDDNAYSQVNHGYARSGPPSANEVDRAARQEAAAAVPTYAVVDKSKKKKKQQEEKPPEYAIVDKSKKKKKKDEKEDYTYAEVDMSKKSSKKQQPKNTDGLVYADLGDFQRPQMPPVSTSPAALPPVKRPPSYEGTQYADITEFMKGDATLPKKRNSQGMEMQPQASAPANVNSQGNEVKPQGANKDESGVPPKESKLQKAVDNTYSKVSSSYVHSGPPSGDGTDATARQQAAAAVPTHAADKTNKISKQKEDKSKEKKKKKKDEKEDCTYAELDKSKKAKKKQQPKDPKCLIYADLEDFSRPLIPPIPTSPKDLPPLKMPTAYEETPYADITEFRKGDPALPKEGNSQAMEMQPQGASSANGNSQGNEVKPQGASPAKDNSQGDEVKPQGASPAIGNSQSSRDANEDESEMRPKESKL